MYGSSLISHQSFQGEIARVLISRRRIRRRLDELADEITRRYRGFVVGYGLDYDNLYRNLPDIRLLKHPAGGPPA